MGQRVATVKARDPDAGSNGQVGIEPGSTQAVGLFQIPQGPSEPAGFMSASGNGEMVRFRLPGCSADIPRTGLLPGAYSLGEPDLGSSALSLSS